MNHKIGGKYTSISSTQVVSVVILPKHLPEIDLSKVVSDVAIFVMKRDVKLQPTSNLSKVTCQI